MSRTRHARQRLRAPLDTTNPQAIKTWAEEMRPILADLRGLADEATMQPAQRTYSRVYLRRRIFTALVNLDARLDAVAIPSASPPPAQS